MVRAPATSRRKPAKKAPSATAAQAKPEVAPATSGAAEAKDADVPKAQPVAEPAPGGDLTRALVASINPKGRRRAGRAFGTEPSEVYADEATLQQLQDDPQLIVKVG